jgi:membrane associated rhomboid family serine protease
MDLVIEPLSVVSIATVIFIISGLIYAFYKKYTITFALIVINFIVFMISVLFREQLIGELAFRQIYLTEQFPQVYTIFTSMFLHADFLHILFNMFMFLLIAPSFEEKIGSKKFLSIYLITGVFAALFHVLLVPIFFEKFDPNIGLIGASGAISGILGAYAVAYPKDRVFFPIIFIIRMPVLVAGLLFLSIQTMYAFTDTSSNIAYLAHIGGFIGGAIIAFIFIKNKGYGLYEQVPVEKRFYDSYNPQKPRKINYSELEKFATNPELKEILAKIKAETVPQVRDIWLEHFFEKAVCPKCGNVLNNFDRRVWCDSCGFKQNY